MGIWKLKESLWVFWVLQLLGAAMEAVGVIVPPAAPWVAHGDVLRQHGLCHDAWGGSAWGELMSPGSL